MKYKVYQLFSFIVGIAVFWGSAYTHAQLRNNDTAALFHGMNGNVNSITKGETCQITQEDPRITALAKQITEAKQTGNISRLRGLEKQMNLITGAVETQFVNDPSVTGMLRTEEHFTGDEDGISTITTGAFWAIATQTSNRSPHIYAAVTEHFQAAGDRLKIYVSYDHGVTWVLKCTFSGFVNGVRYRPEELDIEPLISGTDTLIYAVAGYTFNGNTITQIAKCNVVNGSVNSQSFSFATTTSICYNPRIVSDNSNYTNLSYIYITVSNDSTITANNHIIKARFCVILNPFAASFTQTHRNPGPNSAFWWSHVGAIENSYLDQDVGYFYNTPDNTDVIYVASIFPTLNAVYNAWSNNYGVSNSGSMSITEGFPLKKVRLAFNGGSNNQNGALVYLRNASSNPNGNVDVKVQNTSSGGFLLSTWIPSFLESTGDTATSCDVQAVKLANNKFKFAYTVYGSKCYYISNITQTDYSPRQLVNNLPAGDGFGRVRAGYRVTSDSCLSVWSLNSGSHMYSTYGCDSYVGIVNNNGVPAEFKLMQNYPNPFNPVTNIEFAVPKASFVKLTVYDAAGREVAVLVNKQVNAGTFSVNFDASSLSTGVYFYKITAGNFTDVKKMMLVK